MQTLIKVRNVQQHTYIETAALTIQPDNEGKISLLIEASNHIVTVSLDAPTALYLAGALEGQVQKMGGVL